MESKRRRFFVTCEELLHTTLILHHRRLPPRSVRIERVQLGETREEIVRMKSFGHTAKQKLGTADANSPLLHFTQAHHNFCGSFSGRLSWSATQAAILPARVQIQLS